MSALDRTMLDTSKVLLFIKTVNLLDWERVGLLLETDEGLTTDWAVVKGVCSRVDKRRDWNGIGSCATGRTKWKRPEENPTRSEDTRRWLESGQVLTNVVEGPSGGATLEELTKMVRDL